MADSTYNREPEAENRELHTCRAQLRGLIERNGDGILVVCPEGRIQFANPAACALLQRRCEELLGEPFGVPISPGETTEVDVLTEGKVRIAEMRVVETEWEGQPACLASLRDITEHRRLEAELREKAAQLAEAGRRKDEFLAMLSHELRNPLAPIRTAARVLATRELKDPVAERQVAVIERQAEHLARLVDDLLDVVRVTRGTIPFHQEILELRTQVIEPAVELVQPFISAAGHRLEVSVPEAPVLLVGDAARLQQAVANLLRNSAKYTPDGGRIWLTATLDTSRILLQVRDTGVGIPAELLPRVFELFVQADDSLDRSQGGLGVGLTLVRSLVELHGGQVTAWSGGPGKGSEFTVSLPLASLPPEACEPRGAARPESAPASSRRVLVVDDNRDAAETLAELLAQWGHQPYMAHDGETALRLVAKLHPEVLLLDLGLPGLDGYAVARTLQETGLRKGLLLVALTGYGRSGDLARSAEAGFDHHLIKPVDPEELRRLLAGDWDSETTGGCRRGSRDRAREP